MKKNEVKNATTTAEKAAKEAIAKKAEPKTETEKTDYQVMFKGCDLVFTKTKNENRIGAIIRNCERARNGYKFKVLKSSEDFSGYSEDYKAYKKACDEYMKALYNDLKQKPLDKRLTEVLCTLSAKKEEIEKLIKANLHKTLIKNTLRNRQNMTEEAKEELEKINKATALIIEQGIKLDENGETIVLSSEAKEDELAKLDMQRKSLYEGRNFEKAELSQVSLGTFVKSLEMLIGNFLVDHKDVVAGYETMEERAEKALNKKWQRWEKKAAKVGISAETVREYFNNNDFSGLKKAVEKLEKKTADSEPETTEPAEKTAEPAGTETTTTAETTEAAEK